MQRTIKIDSKGAYIQYQNRQFRPDPGTKLNIRKGATVDISYWSYSGDELSVRQWGGRAAWSAAASLVTEKWKTTDPKVAPKKSAATLKLEREQRTISRTAGYVAMKITVSTTGKVNTGKTTLRGDMAISMNGVGNLTFAEWDSLVAEVQKARDELPLAAIAAQLQADLALEDELQAYIKEKGLAPGGN